MSTAKPQDQSRKLYIVLLVPPQPQAPEGFEQRYDAYWKSLSGHLAMLEMKSGFIKHIFVEGVPQGGQAGLNMLERTNKGAFDLVSSKISTGAVLAQYEDETLFTELIDWGRCLQLGFLSRKVAESVQNSYRSASTERQKLLQSRLGDKVKPGESALLLSSRAENLPVPPNFERFIVAPPELDELERWVRTVNEEILRQAEEEEKKLLASQGQEQELTPGLAGAVPRAQPPRTAGPQPPAPPPARPGGLWTPGQR